MIRLQSRVRLLSFVICGLIAITTSACTRHTVSRSTIPSHKSIDGSYYTVQSGDTLWGIAHSFGLNVEEIASVNELTNPQHLESKMHLYLPSPEETSQFLWPVRGDSRAADLYQGLRIQSPGSRAVRASRSGIVAVAAAHLSGWGKTVIINHRDGYITVYAELDSITVQPGSTVRQGTVVGLVQSEPLYFEIRKEGSVTKAEDVLSLLPQSS